MHYFIIRTRDKLLETVQKFQNKGLDASGICVLEIDYLNFTLDKIQDDHGFIFTSRYGVKGLCHKFTPSPTHHALCIGQATAEQAIKAGFKHVLTPKTPNSDALMDIIVPYQGPLLYCAGTFRKPFLEENLNNFKIPYDIIETYTSLPINQLSEDVKEILRHGSHNFICFSIRNAITLYKLLKQDNLHENHIWHIVGSPNEVPMPLMQSHFYMEPDAVINTL